jgi:cell wall-associated NlpC family hydrolase
MDFARYVGIPFVERGRDFDGCDCWGLLCLFYRNELGIDLPAHEELYASSRDLAGTIGVRMAERGRWQRVPRPLPGDAVCLLVRKFPIHVGVAVDGCRMLHVERGLQAVIERFDGLVWEKRVEGFYRLPESEPEAGRKRAA